MTPEFAKPTHTPVLDVEAVRKRFPILGQRVHGRRLAYLDNGATTQKPDVVIEAVRRYYEEYNANIHRGVHYLSETATAAYEGARETVRGFLNAANSREIIFTRGTTEAINLVAQSYARSTLGPGDEIVITALEHHSNIVPWQLVCEQTGAVLKVAAIDQRGDLVLESFRQLLSERTRLAAFSHLSNALGTLLPVDHMTRLAHDVGALVLIDGAQAVAHTAVDVRELDCDFYAFSGHKLFGPTGIGVLYGKERLLEQMPPWQGGGDMISTVSFTGSTWAALPHKFEAGTPNIAGTIGLAEAIRFVEEIGIERIAAWEVVLLDELTGRCRDFPGLQIYGTASRKAGILSFTLDGIHAHDVGTIMDMDGIAIRVGHHCAMPVMEFFSVPATARASLAVYNNAEDIEQFMTGLEKVKGMLG